MLRPAPIAPGVEVFPVRTPTLPPATHTNAYALGGRDVLLVEPATPYADEQRAFVEWVRGLDAQGRRARAIVLTHHHPDHIGGAEELARELELPLWAHEQTALRLPELCFDRLLEDGELIYLSGPEPLRWRVLHTPGHAPGHVCLHEPALGWVIVGDMVASVGTILIDPVDGDMRAYVEQLERLEALGSQLVLPAHGAPIANPSSVFRFYVAHRQARERKVLDALRSFGTGGATTDDLLPQVYADTATNAWPLARLSIEAHLAKLVLDGSVRTRDERHALA